MYPILVIFESQMAMHLFGNLKKNPNRRILIDSRPLVIDDPEINKSTFHPDFLEDYDGVTEDNPAGHFPVSFGEELSTSIFWNADLAHDIATR